MLHFFLAKGLFQKYLYSLALTHLRSLIRRWQAAVIDGIGGIGKSATAKQFARTHRDYYTGGVFWVNADTLATLQEDYARIARALGVRPVATQQQQQQRRRKDGDNGGDGAGLGQEKGPGQDEGEELRRRLMVSTGSVW